MPPLVISLEEADEMIPDEMFNAGPMPVAVLLEGTFRLSSQTGWQAALWVTLNW
jgi:hypothetical protein